ncbi:MAG: GtrA family protein [Proteobacteria bacterium]|nr:GtrA family protein [Pseudomonadota bacterium]
MHILKHPAASQFLRFGVVGLANTGLSYGSYVLLLALGLNYAVANFGSLVFGIAVSFVSQGRFVFGNSSIRRLPRFVVLWLFLYCVNIALIALFLEYGINAYLGGGLALVPITLLSFVCQRYIVFRPAKVSQ